MVRIADDDPEPSDEERMARTSDQATSGWEQTLEDMEALVEARADEGYETVTVVAGHTAPVDPSSGDTEEWGLSYVVPGNTVEDVMALYERATFEETGVYQASTGPYQFLVTECLDHDANLALYIAGSFEIRFAGTLVRTALEEGRMYSHLQRIDGTPLATIEHDDPEAFFPDPQKYYAYEPDY